MIMPFDLLLGEAGHGIADPALLLDVHHPGVGSLDEPGLIAMLVSITLVYPLSTVVVCISGLGFLLLGSCSTARGELDYSQVYMMQPRRRLLFVHPPHPSIHTLLTTFKHKLAYR